MRRLLQGVDNVSQLVSWAALFLLLPLTSLPLLARLTGANTVAAPSAAPLLWLSLAWFIPFIIRRGTLPRQTLPLVFFVIAVMVSAAAASFLAIPPLKGRSVFAEEAAALLTLGVGFAFYLLLATWPRSTKRLAFTLRLLNWGGFLLLAWSLLQAYIIWFQGGRYPALVVQIQEWVSLQQLFVNRVTGFAFEPSWLAHQLNIVYLPFWLAASLTRYSAHRVRIFKLSLENLFLAAGVVVLFLSFSRVGILAFLLMATFLIFRGILRWIGRLNGRIASRLAWQQPYRQLLAGGTTAILLTVSLGIYLAAAIGLAYGLSRFDSRLAALFDPQILGAGSFFHITNRLFFAERVVYWATGWEIFNDHPFLGVGLGNAGFFFPEKMPDFGYALFEIKQIFYRLTFIPNTKSMWTRLLAETGLVGFSLFAAWQYVLWRSASALQSVPNRLIRTVALAGQLAMVAFLIEGFSIDSFALPYLWVSLGLLTAGLDLYILKQAEKRSSR